MESVLQYRALHDYSRRSVVSNEIFAFFCGAVFGIFAGALTTWFTEAFLKWLAKQKGKRK